MLFALRRITERVAFMWGIILGVSNARLWRECCFKYYSWVSLHSLIVLLLLFNGSKKSMENISNL